MFIIILDYEWIINFLCLLIFLWTYCINFLFHYLQVWLIFFLVLSFKRFLWTLVDWIESFEENISVALKLFRKWFFQAIEIIIFDSNFLILIALCIFLELSYVHNWISSWLINIVYICGFSESQLRYLSLLK